MRIRDSEDIVKSIIEYLTEIVATDPDISRINKAINDINIKKGDGLLPNVSNDVILGQRLKEVNLLTNGRLNIDVEAQPQDSNSTYDRVAKTYIVEVSFVIRDDFSDNIFFRALRMEGVITNIMEKYFDLKQQAGLISGEVQGTFTPDRILLGLQKYSPIASGIIYKLTIF